MRLCHLKTVLLLALGVMVTSTTLAATRLDPMNLEDPRVKPGVEVLLETPQHMALLKGKRVGLITNPSGVDSRMNSTIDLLHEDPNVELVALFGPEHGVRGEAYAGQHVDDYVDDETGVVVHSLYGPTRRPKQEWLENIEVMVYDIQDVGSTSYTYIYTMAYAMEACAAADIPFVVLDRPNPCGADYIDGPVLDTTQHSSFVGLYDMAYMYGMTPGETALIFNKEFNEQECELHVIPMQGYERWMRQWDTGLPFVPTSTHIPHAFHSVYYSLTGVIGELRKGVNIGVGYTLPFECIAAPWIDRDELVAALKEKNLPGVMFRPITFTPKYASYSGKTCHGVHLIISDYQKIRPVTVQIHIMEVLQRLYPDPIETKDNDQNPIKVSIFDDQAARSTLIDKVLANNHIRQMILEGKTAEEIIATFEPRLSQFRELRAKYLIY